MNSTEINSDPWPRVKTFQFFFFSNLFISFQIFPSLFTSFQIFPKLFRHFQILSNLFWSFQSFGTENDYNFFKKKLGSIINKDIKINSLNIYDEILLIGSGKGVASVKTINDIKWRRKSLKFYKILFNFYKEEVLKCSMYK